MPTFIDESGDTGHMRDSQLYFRLAAVFVPTLQAADEFRAAMVELRRISGIEADFEFKFARTHPYADRRTAYFNVALGIPFQFAVCGIDKTAPYWQRASSREQHWATATTVATCLRGAYRIAERPDRPLRDPIWVDDNADARFLAAIEAAFHPLRSIQHPGTPMVRKPRFRGSHPDEMMQLVDMVCGAAGAWMDGDRRWFDQIAGRCRGLIQLP